MTAYPHLLSPIRIGSTTLHNRMVMGAMHTRLETLDRPQERLAAFYAARARGEVGLILTGGYAPVPEGVIEEGGLYLADASHEPTAVLENQERDVMATDGITAALAQLDDRSRRIVEERWLKVNDDGSGGMTLHELAAEYGVSAERIRQIESAAMKKMKKTLAAFA